jgi:SAM-dependent methyltransferase
MADILKNYTKMDIKYKDFWEDQHKGQKLLYLTGSSPEEVFTYHKINPKSNITFLDIGVGTGTMCRYQKNLGNVVVAVDISNTALKNVSGCANTRFLIEDFHKIETESVDMAICHLVIQHCDDEMAKYIITNAYRALKPNGVFSFQFAGVINESLMDNEEISDVRGHHRTLEKIKSWVDEINPSKMEISNRITFQHTTSWWYIIKLYK